MFSKKFLQDVNGIMTEDHMAEVPTFQGGVVGTTAALLDSSNLPESALQKNPNLVSSGVRPHTSLSRAR